MRVVDQSDADPNSPHALARAAQIKVIRARKRRVQRQVGKAQERQARSVALDVSGKAVSPTQRQGSWAEDRALAHLQAAGLVLLARNLACRAGEIDLVCLDGQTLVFVEVRERQDERFGGAAASVDVAKQQRRCPFAGLMRWRWKGRRCAGYGMRLCPNKRLYLPYPSAALQILAIAAAITAVCALHPIPNRSACLPLDLLRSLRFQVALASLDLAMKRLSQKRHRSHIHFGFKFLTT